ncbi:hypothetical protein [Salinivirga cyanobacteriivorans]
MTNLILFQRSNQPLVLFLIIGILMLNYPDLIGQNSQSKLKNPESLESIFPKTLADGINKSGFSTRKSETVNWAGTSYMSKDGAILQVGIWLYTPKTFKKTKRKEKKRRDVVNSGKGNIYYREYMGQHDLKMYFDQGLAVRLTASPDISKKQALTMFQKLPMNEIKAIEPGDK